MGADRSCRPIALDQSCQQQQHQVVRLLDGAPALLCVLKADASLSRVQQMMELDPSCLLVAAVRGAPRPQEACGPPGPLPVSKVLMIKGGEAAGGAISDRESVSLAMCVMIAAVQILGPGAEHGADRGAGWCTLGNHSVSVAQGRSEQLVCFLCASVRRMRPMRPARPVKRDFGVVLVCGF